MTRSKWRRWRWWLFAPLLLLLVAVGAAGLGSQTPAFRDWLRAEVTRRLNVGLNGRLSIGSLDGNLYGELVARDVRLELEGRRVFAARRLHATYRVLALLRGEGLRITSLAVDGVALELVEDARGWNVARLEREPSAAHDGGLAVALDRVQIDHAAVRVVRPDRVWRLRSAALAGTARFASDRTAMAFSTLRFIEVGSGVQLEEGAGRFVLDRVSGWRVEDLRLRTAGSELALRGGAGPPAAPVVDVQLEVPRVAAAELKALLGRRAPVSDLSGDLRADGPLTAVAVRGRIGAWDADREVGAVAVEGSIDVSGASPAGQLRATLTGVDLRGVLGERAPTTELAGSIHVSSAAIASGAGRFEIDLSNPRIGERALTAFGLTGAVERGVVTFDATATAGAGSATAGGTVEPATERFDIHATVGELDLGAITGRSELAGRLNGTLTAVGDGFAAMRARANVHATVAPSRLGELSITAGELAARVDAGRVAVERIALTSNGGTASAAGTLALDADGALREGNLDGALRSADLRPLAAIAGRPGVGGAAELTFAVRGAANRLAATATLKARALTGPDWRVEMLEASLDGSELGSPDARTDGRGRARNVAWRDRRFAAIDLTARWQGTPTVGRGAVELGAEENGARHRLAAEVQARDDERRVTVTALRVVHDGDAWTNVGTPVLVQRGDRITIDDLAVRSAKGAGRVRGALSANGRNDLDIVVEALDVGVFRGLLPQDLEGELAGRAHLGGTSADPRLDADVTIEQPTFGGVRYAELHAHLGVGGGRLDLHGRLAQADDRDLSVDGSLPVRVALVPWRFETSGGPSGRLHAERIDLAFLGALAPGLVSKVGGTLDGDLTVAGSVAVPELRGTVAVADGRAYVVPLGLTYDPVTLELSFEGRAVSIAELAIRSGSGRLDGGGGARVTADGPTIDARFQAQAFPLFGNQYGHGAASGWLWVSGTVAAPVVEGALETDGLVLQIPEVLPTAVRRADPTIEVIGPGAPAPASVSTPPSAPAPPLFDRVALTVQLAVPRNAWIRRSDANIELRGWMTAWKRPAEELQLVGEIRGVRGWYAFQGKKFSLAEGAVRFSGQDLDPVLDITATHQAGDYLVRLKVGGTVSKPTLALESEPALAQADVLSVLLFGARAGDLTGAQSTSLREQALGIAGGYVASELRQSVANALGVDDLQFDTGTAGLQDAKVSIGKYVAEDIFVSLAHRFGAQSVEEIRVEYVIRRGWSIETSTDTLGRSGIDLLWKRQY